MKGFDANNVLYSFFLSFFSFDIDIDVALGLAYWGYVEIMILMPL